MSRRSFIVPIVHYSVILSGALLCAGCMGLDRIAALRDHTGQMQASNDVRRHVFTRSLSDSQAWRRAQEVGKPWLAGRVRPLAREVTLPAALRRDIDTTLLFAGGEAGLSTLAQYIVRATGIAVRVRPDALLPYELFLPRLAVAASAATARATQLAALPQGAQPLPRVLDALAWRLGVYWRYVDNAIEFYRTETRVFDVRALTLNARADARLGRTGKSGVAGFENISQTTLSVGEHDAMAAVRARIEPFLTQAGMISAQAGASGSVVVTDTRDVLEQVARFLDRENKALTRRVRLVFEEITVIAKENTEDGIDWNVVYKGLHTAALTAMGREASAAAGQLSATLNKGEFVGTKAILAALSEMGTIVRHSSVPVVTLNRRPVTHAVRTTFSYVDQVQGVVSNGREGSDSSANGMLPSISVNQKQETVGSFLTLVPDAQEDGQILLSVAYDNTVAQPLKSLAFGKASNRLEIQQITIDGNGIVQQVELRAGQPMIISGFDRRENAYDRRRLTPNAPLIMGGTNRMSMQHATTLILVTAQVEEGF